MYLFDNDLEIFSLNRTQCKCNKVNKNTAYKYGIVQSMLYE